MDATNRDLLICPITHQIFKDPVIADDGFAYEREALIRSLQDSCKSPMTGIEMRKRFIPAVVVRSYVSKFLESHPEEKCNQYETNDPVTLERSDLGDENIIDEGNSQIQNATAIFATFVIVSLIFTALFCVVRSDHSRDNNWRNMSTAEIMTFAIIGICLICLSIAVYLHSD